jgi:hypothetical protein
MDALKNMLSPLGMNTGAIQDTLVGPLSASLPFSSHFCLHRNSLSSAEQSKQRGGRPSLPGTVLWTVSPIAAASISFFFSRVTLSFLPHRPF